MMQPGINFFHIEQLHHEFAEVHFSTNSPGPHAAEFQDQSVVLCHFIVHPVHYSFADSLNLREMSQRSEERDKRT